MTDSEKLTKIREIINRTYYPQSDEEIENIVYTMMSPKGCVNSIINYRDEFKNINDILNA